MHIYAKCLKCSHHWRIRGGSLRNKDGSLKQCPSCLTTQIAEATKQEFEAYKGHPKPSPRAIPTNPAIAIEKAVNEDLKLGLPTDGGSLDDTFYASRVHSLKERMLDLQEKKVEAQLAKLDHNDGGSEVQKLREQVNELRMANMQNQFTSQLQGLQGEFRHMSEVMSRPGADPVESLVTNLARLRQGDVLEMQSSAEVEAVKNQGKFLDKTMTMIDKRMDSIDGAIREYVNFKKEIAMEGRKAQIRENVKLHPGDGPATLGRGGPEPLSPEELTKLAKASDLLLEDDIPKEDVSRMFKCSECGADHLRTSKIGMSHAQFEER